MKKSGLNINMVKAENLSNILYLINKYDKISRKDVAQKTGLTPAAVTKLCNELIENNLIEEIGEEQNETAHAGRKKIILQLKLKDYYALAVNAEVDKISVGIVCFDSTPLCITAIDINSSYDKIIDTCSQVIKESKIDAKKIVCCGLCVIGSPDDSDYNMRSTDELKEKISNAFGIPCFSENNIRAYVLAEKIYAARELDETVLFLKWGPGIGSAIASRGHIFSGNDAGIAEIGHYIIRRDGLKCRCGRYGCLETEVSSMAIEKEAACDMKFDEIIKSSDNKLVNLIDTKTDSVALALTNTATILNAKKIILFGSIFKNESIAKKLSRQCIRYNANLSANMIELSSLNGLTSFIGAAALAAEKYFFKNPFLN